MSTNRSGSALAVESDAGPPAKLSSDDASAELSSRRTGLSFQRTRLSADRTLMSVIRTALSLISFGFTIFSFFRSLRAADGGQAGPSHAVRNFGLTLVCLGVVMLVAGIVYHVRFMNQLREERKVMIGQGLLHGQLSYPVSLTLLTAVLLLLVGFVAIFSMVTRAGPFD